MSITLFKRKTDHSVSSKKPWNNQDIADFYRAVDILRQAGLNTEVDSGVTDEGDPWFVFMRPENGDVIAHFAQINGRFIAVSSINQEVYSGKDIRSIVDQMIACHPVLLPQNKNGGHLFLHPTAAIAAFLAAAFILTIDGVKAENIGEVIFNLSDEVSHNDSQGSVIGVENGSKSESLKGMFSDLNSSNYNSAILGAALIAYELAMNDFNSNQPLAVGDDLKILSGVQSVEGQNPDNNVVTNFEVERDTGGHSAEGYSFTSLQNKFGEPLTDPNILSVEGSGKQEHKIIFQNVGFKEAPGGTISPVENDFHIFWNKGGLEQVNNYQLNVPDAVLSINNEYRTDIKFDDRILNQSDLETSDSFKGIYEEGTVDSVLDLIPKPDGFGIIFDVTGEVKLLPADYLNFSSELIPSFSLSALTSEIGSTYAELVESDSLKLENDLLLENKNEHVPVFDEGVANQSLPIVGHVLKDSDGSLLLTDSVDVVFYQGGNAGISGFELGKDLLWFFLAPEEVSTAENSINTNGDLVLDFGETGTLTFLGIVSEVTEHAFI
jgi:hypothetical protein